MKNTSDQKRLLTGTIWSFTGKLGSILMSLVSTTMLARLLEPAAFGTYFLVLTIARVAILVGQVGMNQVVVRSIAISMVSNDGAKAKDSINKAFVIALVGSSLVAIFYWAFDDFIALSLFNIPLMVTGSFLIVVWILAGTTRIFIAECFRGFHDLRNASLLELFVFELFFLILVISWWIFKTDLVFQNVVALSATAAFISAVLGIYLIHRKIKKFPSVSIVSYGELLSIGWPLLVSNIFVVVMSQAGIWISGIISTPDDVALYTCAFRMSMIVQLPILILSSVVPQLIAEHHEKGEMRKLESSLRGLASIELIPAGTIFLVYCFFGGFLLELLFGQFYLGSFWIMIMLGSGIMVNSWVGFCGPALMMTGNQSTLMKISLFWGIITLLFSYFIGKFYGIYGVAASIALGNALQHLFMVYMVKKKLGIWTMAGSLSGVVWRIKKYVRC